MSTPAIQQIIDRLAAAKAGRRPPSPVRANPPLTALASIAGSISHGARVLDTLTGKEGTVRATRTEHATVQAP